VAENILDIFNEWANNPTASPLPPEFAYAKIGAAQHNSARLREKQQWKYADASAEWIITKKTFSEGRLGEYRYLFPNPNAMDPLTSLSSYKMKGNTLAKGKNRLMVIEPVKMLKDGFIEYPGKLELNSVARESEGDLEEARRLTGTAASSSDGADAFATGAENVAGLDSDERDLAEIDKKIKYYIDLAADCLEKARKLQDERTRQASPQAPRRDGTER
jgi:hypothetical protein